MSKIALGKLTRHGYFARSEDNSNTLELEFVTTVPKRGNYIVLKTKRNELNLRITPTGYIRVGKLTPRKS